MKCHLQFAAAAALLLLAATAAQAQPGMGQPTRLPAAQPLITVNGAGQVSAMPNVVEIDLRTSGAAKLTGDAIVKYRDAKRRTMEAFTELKMENLTIEPQGLAVSSSMNQQQMQMMMQGMTPPTLNLETEFARTLRLRLSKVSDFEELKLMETVGKLLDVAKDSGASVGPTAEQINMGYGESSYMAVRFVLENFDKLEEQAYEKAMADARRRAQRLARLSELELGPVFAVEAFEEDDVNEYLQYQYGYYGGITEDPADHAGDTPRLVSKTFSPVKVSVRLMVQFRVKSPAAAAAAGPGE